MSRILTAALPISLIGCADADFDRGDCDGPGRLALSVVYADDTSAEPETVEVSVNGGGDVEMSEDAPGEYFHQAAPGSWTVTVRDCGDTMEWTETFEVAASDTCIDVYELDDATMVIEACPD